MPQQDRRARLGLPWYAVWLTLAALLAYAEITWRMYQPPPARAVDAPAAVFSAQRAAVILKDLVGNGIPHPLASAADTKTRTQIVQRLRALDIPAELQSGWICNTDFVCGFASNIVAHIDGRESASGSVLLAAHYDSVPAGPGAGDDGIGVASILEIARILKQLPAPRRPIVLLIDEGEETGLLGAQLFVAEHPAAPRVRAVVNLDARGDSGPSLMFETGAATDWSMRLYAQSVAQPLSNSLYYFIYKLLPNSTDFTVFKAAGYQGFNFALIGGVERYHTPLDRFENLDLGSLQHQGENALATVQALAAADLPSTAASRSVFFDVVGRILVRWTANSAAVLGIALTALLLIFVYRIKIRTRVSSTAIGYASIALLCGWLIVSAISLGLLWLLRQSGAVPGALAYSWAAHPNGMHAACIALAVLAPACAARLFANRTGAWALWLANAVWLAALTLISSLRFPEMSFLFVVPAAATVVAAVCRMPSALAALPVLSAGVIFIPSLLLTYTALGTDAWPIITAAFALVVLSLAPMLAETTARNYRVFVWLAVLVVIAGAGLTLASPTYSAQSPQRTLVWYAQDADHHDARWVTQTDSHRVPIELAITRLFNRSGQSIPAPLLNLQAPQLEILKAEARGDERVYRLKIRSLRAAPEIELALPAALEVRTVSVLSSGQTHTVLPWRDPSQTGWLKLIGVPPEGLELEVTTGATRDGAFRIIDRSYGLPEAAAAPHARRPDETSSQDGDLTIVYRSVRLPPIARAPSS